MSLPQLRSMGAGRTQYSAGAAFNATILAATSSGAYDVNGPPYWTGLSKYTSTNGTSVTSSSDTASYWQNVVFTGGGGIGSFHRSVVGGATGTFMITSDVGPSYSSNSGSTFTQGDSTLIANGAYWTGAAWIFFGPANRIFSSTNNGTTCTLRTTASAGPNMVDAVYGVGSGAGGQGRIVCVGSTASFYYNGNTGAGTWTSTSLGMTPTCVTFGNGTFIALGPSTAIRTSTDGTTWSSATVSFGQTINSVAYGNNTFVAVGNGGRIATAADTAPTTWTNQTSGTTSAFTSITFGGGKFFATTATDMYYSADAVTWTKITIGAPNTLAVGAA